MKKNIVLIGLFAFIVSVGTVSASQYQPDWAHQGRLEVVESNYIIVSDSRYDTGSNLKYFSLSGKYVSKYDFTEGAKVALSLKDGTREVNALWLIDAEIP
jgi:hypothetical protein